MFVLGFLGMLLGVGQGVAVLIGPGVSADSGDPFIDRFAYAGLEPLVLLG